MLAGTWTAASLLVTVTTAPPVGAADWRRTEPVAELPPPTEAGATVNDRSDTPPPGGGGFFLLPPLANCVAGSCIGAVSVVVTPERPQAPRPNRATTAIMAWTEMRIRWRSGRTGGRPPGSDRGR